MPTDKNKYPKNWKSIATAVKEAADWTCQHCDRPCREPGQGWIEFVGELIDDEQSTWYEQTCDEVKGEIVERPQRFTLTVAHLDHDTTNNSASNLKALCSGCHLRYDLELHKRNSSTTRQRRKEQAGQQTLALGV